MSEHHNRFDYLISVTILATLVTIGLLFFQTQQRVAEIEGPVCAQLRDLTDRNVRAQQYELSRIKSVLEQESHGFGDSSARTTG